MSLHDLKQMSVNERIYLMEQLWASFQYDDHKIDSPTWHKEILSDRKERYKKGQLKLFSLDELKQSY
jgi:putative addiction module component (TIGR02574 family)